MHEGVPGNHVCLSSVEDRLPASSQTFSGAASYDSKYASEGSLLLVADSSFSQGETSSVSPQKDSGYGETLVGGELMV